MSVRSLFGRRFRISMGPVRSPTGVVSVMVPVMDRDVSFASAARPPIAAM